MVQEDDDLVLSQNSYDETDLEENTVNEVLWSKVEYLNKNGLSRHLFTKPLL